MKKGQIERERETKTRLKHAEVPKEKKKSEARRYTAMEYPNTKRCKIQRRKRVKKKKNEKQL